MIIPEVEAEKNFTCVVKDRDKVLAEFSKILKPAAKRTIYILPHSHTDIGYTDIQTAIEDKQVENLKTSRIINK